MMQDLIQKYKDKKLSTDDYAQASNEVKKAIEELENLEFNPIGEDHLLLKWGTLKGWKLNSEKGKELLKQYFALGSSASAMLQKDTEKQQDLILQMIDECNGFIQSDWSGEYMTKAEAKKYIMENK